MEVIESVKDLQNQLYIPDSETRPEGLHISNITYPKLRSLYPKWYKEYDDDETIRQIRMFEKGHIVEEAWGDALSRLIAGWVKPSPRRLNEEGKVIAWQVISNGKVTYKGDLKSWGVWVSPDGHAADVSTVKGWPDNYPKLVFPAIFECKAGLKSCHPEKSPITSPKFYGWIWATMGYCLGWEANDVYLFSHHFQGDYTGFPPESTLMVHHLHFDQEELEEHWEDLVRYAKDNNITGEEE